MFRYSNDYTKDFDILDFSLIKTEHMIALKLFQYITCGFCVENTLKISTGKGLVLFVSNTSEI